jgi:hypothetical protein
MNNALKMKLVYLVLNSELTEEEQIQVLDKLFETVHYTYPYYPSYTQTGAVEADGIAC